MSTPEYTTILAQLKLIKADAETGLEHDRAIMAFVFFNFCLLILLLILTIMIYKIMPRGGSAPPVTTTYMSPVISHGMEHAAPHTCADGDYRLTWQRSHHNQMPPPPPPVISMPGPMPSMAPPMRTVRGKARGTSVRLDCTCHVALHRHDSRRVACQMKEMQYVQGLPQGVNLGSMPTGQRM